MLFYRTQPFPFRSVYITYLRDISGIIIISFTVLAYVAKYVIASVKATGRGNSLNFKVEWIGGF